MDHCLDYSKESDRLLSFVDWPNNFVDPKDLAKFGFYKTGDKDIATCFYCNISIFNWELGDTAREEHIKYSPNCPIFREGESRDVCGTGMPSSSFTYSNYQNRLETFKDFPLIKQKPEDLAKAGFYYTNFGDRVICFCCGSRLQLWLPEDDPWVEHAKFTDGCEFLILEKGIEFIESIKKKVEEKSEAGIETVEEKSEAGIETVEEKSDGSCKICCTNNISIVFIPCGHALTCVECSLNLNDCPVCRKSISLRNRLYIS